MTLTKLVADRSPGSPVREVRIRSAYPSDETRVRGLLAALGTPHPATRYHAPQRVPPSPDRSGTALARGVVAVVGHGPHETVVGFGSWRPTEDPGVGEAVLAVADGWRVSGVAERLLGLLCRHATRAGIRTFTAEMVPHNAVLRATSRVLGYPERRAGVAVRIDLPEPFPAS